MVKLPIDDQTIAISDKPGMNKAVTGCAIYLKPQKLLLWQAESLMLIPLVIGINKIYVI